MKRILILAISALVVLVGLRRPSLSGGEATRRQDESRTLAQINSYAATLFELAGERFSAHVKRGEKWILTVHEWTKDPEVKKYSNNKYVIVSLPAQEWQIEGFCLYATHYNDRWMKDADLMVMNAGRYKEAREIYS